MNAKVVAYADYASASLALARAIDARFGVDALDDLVVEAFQCPHDRNRRYGVVLAAWPRDKGAAAGDLLLAYYGDIPEPAL